WRRTDLSCLDRPTQLVHVPYFVFSNPRRAVTATARKLAVLVYRTLNEGLVYADPGVEAYDARHPGHVLRRLRHRVRISALLISQPAKASRGHFLMRCCVNLMAILLVVGVMDLRAMAAVATAISVERLALHGDGVARAIGTLVVGACCCWHELAD